MKLDPTKKDQAIIDLLCQIVARQEVLMNHLLTVQVLDEVTLKAVRNNQANELQRISAEMKAYLFEHYGKTPDGLQDDISPA